MAYIVMADTVMAYMVMGNDGFLVQVKYSYGLHNHGLYSYGFYSYGLCYGQRRFLVHVKYTCPSICFTQISLDRLYIGKLGWHMADAWLYAHPYGHRKAAFFTDITYTCTHVCTHVCAHVCIHVCAA